MSENLAILRDAGIAHESHEFTESEIAAIESLSPEEIEAVISVKNKLGHELASKKSGGDEMNPDTFVL